MFAGFFIRLMFGVLLFLIAIKKGYGKFFWGAMGIILGPIALIAIFLYRENVNYNKAFISGLTGALIGAGVSLSGWFLLTWFPTDALTAAQSIERTTFWNLLLPGISLGLGLVFFCVTLIRTSSHTGTKSRK